MGAYVPRPIEAPVFERARAASSGTAPFRHSPTFRFWRATGAVRGHRLHLRARGHHSDVNASTSCTAWWPRRGCLRCSAASTRFLLAVAGNGVRLTSAGRQLDGGEGGEVGTAEAHGLGDRDVAGERPAEHRAGPGVEGDGVEPGRDRPHRLDVG